MRDLAVARAFGRAAPEYDLHARVQRVTATSLAALVDDTLPPGPAVDLGCGTAPLARRLAAGGERRWLALDLAPAMLREARARGRLDGWWLACADFAALPLATASLALVWSSFALQWAPSPAAALGEIGRVLRPGGRALLALPVAGSLRELKEAWAEVDDGRHVNALAAERDWLAAVPSGLAVQDRHTLTITEHHADLKAIHRMLRGSGAHRVQGARGGLGGRARLRRLTAAYERRRQPEGLPLTWQVLFLTLEKPA